MKENSKPIYEWALEGICLNSGVGSGRGWGGNWGNFNRVPEATIKFPDHTTSAHLYPAVCSIHK